MRPGFDLTLYLVTDPSAPAGVVETAEAAARGGATLVQLRDKDASNAALGARIRDLKARLDPLGAPLILNDRPDIARATSCAGAHIGQSDGAVAAARAALGAEAILGLSIETPAQLDGVDWSAVDYVGAGPVKATSTKPDHAPPIGFDGLAEIRRLCPVPVVAIGGLGAADAAGAKAAGASGLAVVSAICAAADPEAAAREILQAWRTA